MKIFTAAQIHACDAYTIKASGISSTELMERASGKCVTWLREHFPKDTLFVALCRKGLPAAPQQRQYVCRLQV